MNVVICWMQTVLPCPVHPCTVSRLRRGRIKKNEKNVEAEDSWSMAEKVLEGTGCKRHAGTETFLIGTFILQHFF